MVEPDAACIDSPTEQNAQALRTAYSPAQPSCTPRPPLTVSRRVHNGCGAFFFKRVFVRAPIHHLHFISINIIYLSNFI
jgi:hypothetical protein